MTQITIPTSPTLWGLNGSESPQAFLSLALLGLTSHTFFSRYNNVDLLVGRYFVPFLCAQLGLWLWLSMRGGSFRASFFFLFRANASFFGPLFASISLYRLFFHPLRKYPGPTLARLTTWWGVWKIARGANKYQLHHELHRQHGTMVRIAPNFLSINSLEGLAVVYGAGTKCGKSHTFYGLRDETSLQTELNLKKHGARRPPWEKALSAKKSLEYLPHLYELTDLMVKRIGEDARKSDKGILINHWLTCFVFDMMGKLGYSKSYGCLETGVVHPAIVDMETFLETAVILSALPWLVRIISSVISTPKHMQSFLDFAISSLDERRAAKVETPDVLSYVFQGKVKLSRAEQIEDTMLLQLGGSDTTNSTLTFCVYHLATSPEIQSALRDEIRSSAGTTTDFDWDAIKHLPLLEGVINETLRMHPAVPGGLPRMTPPEGIHIGSIYIPGNTTVSCPTWTIQHDPENFTNPTNWDPYRWIKPPANHNPKAFIPFSVGPFNCVGKAFAIMEMKYAISKLVGAFEIRLAPGEDGHKIMHESKDCTGVICEPLWLDMKPIVGDSM